MRAVVPPSTLHPAGRPSDDEMDGLLHAFYQAELPNPWPALAAPELSNGDLLRFRDTKARLLMTRTRWALAACVAFLVAGTLVLSPFFDRTHSETVKSPEPSVIDSASADTKPLPFTESLIQKDDGSVGGIRIDFHNRPNK